MARTFWNGNLSFGLVEIPVRLITAEESHDLSFTLLDRSDFSPVGYKRYNKNSGKEVGWDHIVRGYEYEPDEYVVLSDEELKHANVKATQSIEIVEFVDAREIDSVFFETPYYIEPAKKDSKAYALLRETLERTGKVAIGRVVLRTRQRMAAILVRDGVLVLNLLRYAHELKSRDVVQVPGAGGRSRPVSDRELHMAEQLVEGMSAKWNPEKYQDEYHDDVLELVKKKVKSGQTHTIVEPKEEGEKPRRREVVDLMPLLKESLAAHTGRSGRAPAARKTRTAQAASERTGRRASGERKRRKSA